MADQHIETLHSLVIRRPTLLGTTGLFVCLLTATCVGCSSNEPPPKPADLPITNSSIPAPLNVDTPTKADSQEANGPRDVLRSFLLALAGGDSQKAGSLIVPNDDSKLLWGGEAAPPEVIEEMSRGLDAQLQPLKVGDRVDLPNGKTVEIDESHVNANRAEFTMAENPIPFVVLKIDGVWRVDATHLIAARKTAQLAAQPRSEWQLDASVLNQLGEEVDMEFGFRTRLPLEFESVPGGNPSVRMWRGKPRSDGSMPTITLVLAEAGENEAPRNYQSAESFENFCKAMQKKVRVKLDWSSTPTERGKVGGVPFNRATSTGSGSNGNAVIQSVNYQGVSDRTIIMFSAMDTAVHFEESAALLEAVILSLHK